MANPQPGELGNGVLLMVCGPAGIWQPRAARAHSGGASIARTGTQVACGRRDHRHSGFAQGRAPERPAPESPSMYCSHRACSARAHRNTGARPRGEEPRRSRRRRPSPAAPCSVRRARPRDLITKDFWQPLRKVEPRTPAAGARLHICGAKRVPLGAGLERRTALSGYAYSSEFSAGRCGSNTSCNRANWDKPSDPGLQLLPLNAWSRLKPHQRNTLRVRSPVQVP